MQSECLPFNSIPESSQLFLDYLYAFPKVSRFYPQPPLAISELFRQPPRQSPELKARLADVLIEQNRRWGASQRTLKNIELLRAGAPAVLTGQQVALFGGPAYVFYKAMSAIKLAEQGRDCVPVFWMAGEDHDLAEVNHVVFPQQNGTLKELKTASHGVEDAPVGSIVLERDVAELLRCIKESSGQGAICTLLEESYQPGTTFTNAFAQLLTRLFTEFGLVLIDPADRRIHQLSAEIYLKTIAQSAELNQALLARKKELEAAGYHAQVKVTESTSLLFAVQDGARIPVQRRNGNFVMAGQVFSADELQEQISKTPQNFNANALLRPVVQDFLFPTVAYIGGPAEIAYFAQSQVLYQRLLGRVTPVLPRLSATIVEPHIQHWMAKYSLRPTDLLQSEEKIRLLLAQRSIPGDLQQQFAAAKQQLEELFEPLRQSLRQLDPTIAQAAETSARKMHYQLANLEERAASAAARRSGEVNRHARALWSAFFPQNGLQERTIAGSYFLARCGADLLPQLLQQVRPECPDHQLINL